MKVLSESEYLALLGWFASICVVLLCLAALFYLFPELPPVSRARRPFAPQVRYLVAESAQYGKQGDSAELSAVWSPALISLPNGVISPGFGKNHINWVMPPLEASHGRALFLERSAPDLAYDRASIASLPGQDTRSATFRSMLLADPPVFERSGAGETNRVRMALFGGLKGRTIDCSCLSLGEWARPGASWAVTLYVRFNDAGRPVQVFLDSPAPDKALNEEAVRKAYQCSLPGLGEPCEGRITLWFFGNGPATASVRNNAGTQTGP